MTRRSSRSNGRKNQPPATNNGSQTNGFWFSKPVAIGVLALVLIVPMTIVTILVFAAMNSSGAHTATIKADWNDRGLTPNWAAPFAGGQYVDWKTGVTTPTPNYWLDPRKGSIAQAQVPRRGDGSKPVAGCESGDHLARVLTEPGVIQSGSISRRSFTIDGQTFAGVGCTATNDGSVLVLGTAEMRVQLTTYWQGLDQAGIKCGPVPASWGPDWKCGMSGLIDNLKPHVRWEDYTIETPALHAIGVPQCFEWKQLSNVFVYGHTGNEWVNFSSGMNYFRVAFTHTQADGPQAFYYRFYPRSADGVCRIPT